MPGDRSGRFTGFYNETATTGPNERGIWPATRIRPLISLSPWLLGPRHEVSCEGHNIHHGSVHEDTPGYWCGREQTKTGILLQELWYGSFLGEFSRKRQSCENPGGSGSSSHLLSGRIPQLTLTTGQRNTGNLNLGRYFDCLEEDGKGAGEDFSHHWKTMVSGSYECSIGFVS
nr:hypothetical protein Iba_chr01aCG11270 [Ipomoea batatas]